jgi:hypothetical protein
VRKFKEVVKKFVLSKQSVDQKILQAGITVFMSLMGYSIAYADGPDMSKFDELMGFFAAGIQKVGLAVGFCGGVMFALAIKNDDADAKQRGLLTLAAGFITFALAQAYTTYFSA